MATVYDNFEHNLKDIIDTGLRGGAKVVVSIVARNLKDCGPFASDHRPGLSAEELSRWDGLYQVESKRKRRAGRWRRSTPFSRRRSWTIVTPRSIFDAANVFSRWVRTRRLRANSCLPAIRTRCAFRADSRINEIIRRGASNRDREGVHLVDAEAAMAAQSPHGLVGEEFLYEHVHLNFEGNYLVARAPWLNKSGMICSAANMLGRRRMIAPRRLGRNDSTRRAGEMDVRSRLNDPPFKEQKPITGNNISVCSNESNGFKPQTFPIPCVRKKPAPKPRPTPLPTTGFSRKISPIFSSELATAPGQSNQFAACGAFAAATRTPGRAWVWGWMRPSAKMKPFQPFKKPLRCGLNRS